MRKDYLLSCATARKLYDEIKELPIYDYHCHLSPREIYEDKPFRSISQMWLSGDHYKWRLMRQAGTDEKYVTGDGSDAQKFEAYAAAIEYAAGNPLYHWTKMELSRYFRIEEQLTRASAESIRLRADEYIAKSSLSPRKLIEESKVAYIATTDDPASSLVWHERIAADISFRTKVTPSFRCDRMLMLTAGDYPDYIRSLQEASGVTIKCLSDLESATEKRLADFISLGCKMTDLGIPVFPDRIYSFSEADRVFRAALAGESISEEDLMGWLGNRMVSLGCLYAKNNMVMQLHLAVCRNANTELFKTYGADAGGDCIGDAIPVRDIIRILDRINSTTGLPKTVLYTLNPAMNATLSSVAGSFPGVICGSAWWFCDHKRGIAEQINNIAETSNIGLFLGMLTDSRSFLSYARHDYFRRILCSTVAEWTDSGEFDEHSAPALIKNICCENIRKLLGE